MIQIAIDGPASAGKSSIAKLVAERLGIAYLDTGAMYRAVGLYALRNGASVEDESQIAPLLEGIELDISIDRGGQRIYLNGEDVSSDIRRNEISKAASAVSALPAVRTKLVAMQREIAGNKSVVMDGRDIGTVVLPCAEYKFFVTATPFERARRRHLELAQRGMTERSLEDLQAEIEKRDYDDSHRVVSPLRMAIDAVLIDTTDMSLEQVAEAVLKRVNSSGRE